MKKGFITSGARSVFTVHSKGSQPPKLLHVDSENSDQTGQMSLLSSLVFSLVNCHRAFSRQREVNTELKFVSYA